MLFIKTFQANINLLKSSKSGYNTLIRYFGIRHANSYSQTVKFSLVGAGIGVLVGVGYYYPNLNKSTKNLIHQEHIVPVIKDPPKITPSRKVCTVKVVMPN